MKLLSFIHQGRETWGALVGTDAIVDLGKALPQYPTLTDYIASGAYLKASADVANKTADVKLADITFLPVIPKPEKIVCAVRNYMDHHQEVLAAGMQRELSEEPPIFLRVWRSQVAHGQPIVCPKVSASLDWEGELAVIIGKEGRNIAEADAFNHVAGYSCYNDGSIREWQFHAKQIASGKNFESTGGFGPWMVTADEIAHTAEFFSFGTNDLTQTCLGMSRDDSGSFLGAYTERALQERSIGMRNAHSHLLQNLCGLSAALARSAQASIGSTRS